MEIRSFAHDFTVREDENSEKYIEGHFAVFDSPYYRWDGAIETVSPSAFKGALDDDIRALYNHDTNIVLGRNKANTLELRTDGTGLWGRVKVNPKDSDAMNLYERVKRGDVDQCSFGFDILDEETDFREDGSIHWTIKAVKLYEVSVCTFPAYEETSVSARKQDLENIKKRENEAWKAQMLSRISKGGEQ